MNCRVDGGVYSGLMFGIVGLATIGYMGFVNTVNNFYKARVLDLETEVLYLREKLARIHEESDVSTENTE
jgi:hypothetical protein